MLNLSHYIGLGEREVGLLLAVIMGLLIAGFILVIFLSERRAAKKNPARPFDTNKQGSPSEIQKLEL